MILVGYHLNRLYSGWQEIGLQIVECIQVIEYWHKHYNDVVMSAMASEITGLTIVYSTVYSGADQRKHQSSASLAFVPAQRASNAGNVSIWWRHHEAVNLWFGFRVQGHLWLVQHICWHNSCLQRYIGVHSVINQSCHTGTMRFQSDLKLSIFSETANSLTSYFKWKWEYKVVRYDISIFYSSRSTAAVSIPYQ